MIKNTNIMDTKDIEVFSFTGMKILKKAVYGLIYEIGVVSMGKKDLISIRVEKNNK